MVLEAGRADADPELPFLMLRLTEDLVLPVTTVPDDEDPTADSFILEHVGDVLVSALRDWQRDSPTTDCIGLARSLLRFITRLLTDRTAARRAPGVRPRRRLRPAGAGARGALGLRPLWWQEPAVFAQGGFAGVAPAGAGQTGGADRQGLGAHPAVAGRDDGGQLF